VLAPASLALLVGLTVTGLALAEKPAAPAPKAGGPVKAAVFSHEEHAKHLDLSKCTACHKDEESSRPAPTSKSHTPCLSAGCHIDDFLGTGPRTEAENPELFRKATAFCLSCHPSSKGRPPSRFAKVKATGMFADMSGANYHVEMNHLEHTKRATCSTCHVVDPSSFELVLDRPSHVECAKCHADSKKKPMSDCGNCHTEPGPKKYFTQTHKRSDVRVCTGNDSGDPPCFKHERKEHRFDRDDKPIECSACHYMVESAKHGGFSYKSLADLKAAPIIDNKGDMAHKKCGASGCHRSEVDDSSGRGKCKMCHSSKTISLWD
jgi:hypothetical protein